MMVHSTGNPPMLVAVFLAGRCTAIAIGEHFMNDLFDGLVLVARFTGLMKYAFSTQRVASYITLIPYLSQFQKQL